MKNTNAYLIQRAKTALRVKELEPKDLSIDMLMTAYASVYEFGDAGNDQRITMKVPALATHYAKLLDEGKFVVINDPNFNRWFFVTAHEADLIAVYFAIGPWLNVYGIKCTSEETLRQLNITAANTTDLKLIDNIFGFRPWNPEEEDLAVTQPPAVVVPDTGVRWNWHAGHRPEAKKEKKVLEGATAEVSAPAHLVEAAGAPTDNHGVEVTTSTATNQMQRAFQHAGHGRRQDQRENRRHAERRAHELNQPHGEKSK